MTATPLLETRQAFGSSLNVDLGFSRGGRPEGALGYRSCGVRQGSSGEADGEEVVTYFQCLPMPSPSTLTLKSCAVSLTGCYAHGRCGLGGLTLFWFMGAFEDETIRQQYNPVRPVITRLARTSVREVRKGESGVSPSPRRPPCLGRELPAVGTHPSSGVPVCRHPRCCLRTCFVRTCAGMVVDRTASWPPRSPQPASQGQPLQLCLSLLPGFPQHPAPALPTVCWACSQSVSGGRARADSRGEGCSGAGVPVACCRAPAWSLARALT